MSSTMIDKDRLEELAAELAKGVKSEEDLADQCHRQRQTTEKRLNKIADSGFEKRLYAM